VAAISARRARPRPPDRWIISRARESTACPFVSVDFSADAAARILIQQKRANRLVQDYVRSGKNLDYIELWDQFLGPDGKPREDLFVEVRLHNDAEGYKIRAEVVRPHLQ
jgi:hypothetical protein